MSLIFKNMRGLIGLMVVLGTILFDFMLAWKAIPVDNKELLYTAAGGLNTLSAGIIAYYFGSSKDKSDQEKATIIKDANQP